MNQLTEKDKIAILVKELLAQLIAAIQDKMDDEGRDWLLVLYDVIEKYGDEQYDKGLKDSSLV